MEYIYWDHYYNAVLLVNLLVVVGIFTSLRLFSGTIAHINASDELLKKDNPAFGISLAGATLAITVMLSGTVYGSMDLDLFHSLINIVIYGLLGIMLMAVTRIIFNKVTLADVPIRDDIVQGNKVEGFLALLIGYAISQVILTGATLINLRVFARFHPGSRIQDELKKGNMALALRVSGQKIGTAFALATAAQVVIYEEYDFAPMFLAWFAASIVAIVILKIICRVAERVILFRINLNDEVIRQQNIALGAFQAAIYVSLGYLLSTL
ncbi:MAG: hypothetical protein HYU57_00500 [Micavibrio aeruginosavorus]|nr:hypothetical protein [Micavibrio aeruginosavorus]